MLLARCSRWLLYTLVTVAAAAVPSATAGAGGDNTPGADTAPANTAASGRGPAAASTKTAYAAETLRGRMVWMADALERRYGIETDADAVQAVIAVETGDGKLIPIVKDFRSRGFWLDPRLRAMEVEVLVRRYEKSPVVQVVRWYAVRQGRKYEVDYWCDICAIPMYELKTCDCCQGETRLRERLV